MNIVIFGHGVTGTATGAVFETSGFQVAYIDPPKGEEWVDSGFGFQPDFVFLCVPTPTGNLSFVEDAIQAARILFPKTPIVIRSTIPPGTISYLTETYRGSTFVLMPEFLREQYAVEDALKRDKAFYATHDDAVAEKMAIMLAKAKYQLHTRVSVEACELVKIALNSMLAVKVAFANVLYDVARANKANYDELVNMMLADGWLSRFGLQVPGRHGRGYSGTCLPKDLGWLIRTVDVLGEDKVLSSDKAQAWMRLLQGYNRDLLDLGTEAPHEVLKEAV